MKFVAKNYNLFEFVKVMSKVLLVPFPRTRCTMDWTDGAQNCKLWIRDLNIWKVVLSTAIKYTPACRPTERGGVAGASAPGPGVLRGPGGPPQKKI